MEDANAAMKEAPKVVLRCKLCMVGDAGVGKTALTEVYTKGGSKFPKSYSMVRATRSLSPPNASQARAALRLPPGAASKKWLVISRVALTWIALDAQTADASFMVQVVDIPDTNFRVELCIFDVPGQGICRESSLKLCEDAAAICVVFDVSNEQSFENCAIWTDEIRTRSGRDHIRGALVANKTDLEDRVFGQARMRGQQFAGGYGLQYFETSAVRSSLPAARPAARPESPHCPTACAIMRKVVAGASADCLVSGMRAAEY